jgi:hypothetical protein
MRKAFVGATVVAGAILFAAVAYGEGKPAPKAAVATTDSIVIDFGDGAEKFFPAVEMRAGQTVWDVTDALQAHPHGIKVKKSGDGPNVFLTQIDDVASEGGGADKRNWQLWVNDEYAKVGAGSYQLNPNDRIAWRFALSPPGSK